LKKFLSPRLGDALGFLIVARHGCFRAGTEAVPVALQKRFDVVSDIVDYDVPRLIVEGSRRFDIKARQSEQARIAIVLDPFRAVRPQKFARPQFFAALVDPDAQPVPIPDQRLVADFDVAASPGLVGD